MPQSIRQATFTIFGVEMHCHILDDGRRIIEAGDFERLLEAMQRTGSEVYGDELDEFAAWMKGVSQQYEARKGEPNATS